MKSKSLFTSSILISPVAVVKRKGKMSSKRSILAFSVIVSLLVAVPAMAQGEASSSTADQLRQPSGVPIDRYQRAEEVWRQMLPPNVEPWSADNPSQNSMGTTLSRLAFENAYVQLWTRPALSLRDRSLVTISMLIAQGSEKELALHVASGLRNGLTPEEIEEVIYQATAYASFPRASQAAGVVGKVLAQERQNND